MKFIYHGKANTANPPEMAVGLSAQYPSELIDRDRGDRVDPTAIQSGSL
jgi:hypothetical protein